MPKSETDNHQPSQAFKCHASFGGEQHHQFRSPFPLQLAFLHRFLDHLMSQQPPLFSSLLLAAAYSFIQSVLFKHENTVTSHEILTCFFPLKMSMKITVKITTTMETRTPMVRLGCFSAFSMKSYKKNELIFFIKSTNETISCI